MHLPDSRRREAGGDGKEAIRSGMCKALPWLSSLEQPRVSAHVSPLKISVWEIKAQFSKLQTLFWLSFANLFSPALFHFLILPFFFFSFPPLKNRDFKLCFLVELKGPRLSSEGPVGFSPPIVRYDEVREIRSVAEMLCHLITAPRIGIWKGKKEVIRPLPPKTPLKCIFKKICAPESNRKNQKGS